MQEAVDDDAMEFLFWCDLIEFGISFDGIEADVNVSAERVVFTVIEADVVRVIVVSDEATVDVEHCFIIYENDEVVKKAVELLQAE